jgi:hypothetical protein
VLISLGKESCDGSASISDGDWARAVHEFVVGIYSQCGMNCGVEVGNGNRVFDDFFGEAVGGSESALMI